MVLHFNGDEYRQCYGNKFVRMKDPEPFFDILHPLKMMPIPMYKYENGKMTRFMVPCQITVEKVAPRSDFEYLKIKERDLENWKYLKEKMREWAIENAARRAERSKINQALGIDIGPHGRLVTPFMERFKKNP